jgi:hypothetical protein
MEVALGTLVTIFLSVLVVIVVAVVLFVLARRIRKEQALIGFTASSKDEKYVGYFLLATGFVIIFLSIYQIVIILSSGFSSSESFGLSSLPIPVGEQSKLFISEQILGLIESILFWLLLLGYGGGKIASLGFDMLKGRKIKFSRTLTKAITMYATASKSVVSSRPNLPSNQGQQFENLAAKTQFSQRPTNSYRPQPTKPLVTPPDNNAPNYLRPTPLTKSCPRCKKAVRDDQEVCPFCFKKLK